MDKELKRFCGKDAFINREGLETKTEGKPTFEQESEEGEAQKKKVTQSALSKRKARKDPIYKEIENLKNRMKGKIGEDLRLVLSKLSGYAYKNEWIEVTGVKPKVITLTLPENEYVDVIAQASFKKIIDENRFKKELEEAKKKKFISFSLKNNDQTIISIII